MNKRVKNTILKAITILALFGWMITACSMDSENVDGLIIINGVCLAWLFLMALANGQVVI